MSWAYQDRPRAESISKDLNHFANDKAPSSIFCAPGKPTDNANIESLNGKFKTVFLNAFWFANTADARRQC
ncbi:MAG: integrase core domain-containing protein [Geminicoccales bacterium]